MSYSDYLRVKYSVATTLLQTLYILEIRKELVPLKAFLRVCKDSSLPQVV